MFRSVADVVLKDDLRGYLKLPRDPTAASASSSPRQRATAFRRLPAASWPQRIKAIESARGRAQQGDDILLSVITDGRHAAIDMRLVWPATTTSRTTSSTG